MVDVNACGNAHIDGLARRGRLMDVWAKLAHRYTDIAASAEAIWVARKDGRIRRLVERDARFQPLLNNAGIGPQTEAEWDLLADACRVAIQPQSYGAVTARTGGSVAPERTAA